MIQSGKVVNLAYSLTNSKGDILDSADAKNPFTYLHGASQIIPGLESGLEGLNTGDKKVITVAPEQAYGQINPELKLAVKRNQFPAEMEIKPGMEFETQNDQGFFMTFLVDSVNGEDIIIDANHPLAGQTLRFSIEVLSIREATEEEKSHGHAHGHDGHQHHH